MNAPVLARSLLLFRDLEEALAALEAAGVKVLIVKGPVLALHLYPRPDLRPMEDLDLLVEESEAGRAREALKALGYAARPGSPTELKRGSTTIDLEADLWYWTPVEAERARREAVTLESGGLRLRTLSWEDHFVFILAHSAAHHAWWDAVHAEDLRRLLGRPLDWKEAASRLEGSRLAAAAAASFELLGLRPPAELAGLASSIAGRLETRVWLAVLRARPLPGAGHLLRLWTAPSRPAFLLGWLFPGEAFLSRRYATRRPRIYAALRPFLLAAQALAGAARSALSSGSGSPVVGRTGGRCGTPPGRGASPRR